jgi:hypothetical protein
MNAAATLHPPERWTADGYDACRLCDHREHNVDGLLCQCPAVVAPNRWQSAAFARTPHGACGPEARYMSFPGLHG